MPKLATSMDTKTSLPTRTLTLAIHSLANITSSSYYAQIDPLLNDFSMCQYIIDTIDTAKAQARHPASKLAV
ncbi:hypothetical protein [Sorangium sp. So ce542]|uniref:hypothetical protein n=1 Tax=Sorangium sp. So ce542 TaxID=3133316 RepID=UPI003F63BF68